MSTPQEILQGMIDAAPEQAAKAQQSIDQIQTSIDDFQEKQDAMKSGVGDVAINRFEQYLLETKFLPAEDYNFLTGSNYNQIESGSGSLTDWKVYKIMTVSGLTYFDASNFTCSGDQTAIFIAEKDLAVKLGSTFVYSTVLESLYSEETLLTTVTLNDAILTIALSDIFEKHYEYSAGDDTQIDNYKSQWDFAHDYIIKPLGTDGTYGTQDNIAKLELAKNMLTNNKAKVNDSITVFNDFV